MVDIFNKICRECNGDCCKTYEIFLTKDEFERLSSIKKMNTKEEGSGFLMCHKERCVFLEKDKCILNEDSKPVDCLMSPLVFTYKNNKLNFYLLKDCKFVDKLSEKKIGELKNLALKRLANWTDDDKKTFSKFIEEWPTNELIKL